MTTRALGIDLGTTNSVVAIVADGSPVVVPNAVGSQTTPSAVYMESPGQAVVGEEARLLAAVDPANGVCLIKRHMGTDFRLIIHGEEHTPESISALILKQLAAAAGASTGAPVVITVPAYFGTAEREATAQAARIAGLDVLELLDEPVAAAVHYGLDAGERRCVLVYDLGGGTFDTTVLTIERGSVTVVATDGHHKLGGADIDDRLLNLVLQKLEPMVHPEELERFSSDDAALGNLLVDIEAVKRGLSESSSRDLQVRIGRDRLCVPVVRAELEQICGDLFDSTMGIIARVLEKARAKGATRIEEIIMVGGSSRIPLLAERLHGALGLRPRLVDPDLAVAKGAALRAQRLTTGGLRGADAAAGSSSASGQVTPVTPRALGLLIEDSYDPTGERSFVAHVVPAHEPLPLRRSTRDFGTIVDRQPSVRIQVFEQAGPDASPEVEHNNRVLDGELTGLSDLPAGAVVEVVFDIAIDGRIMVVAREPISGRELTLEAYVEGVVDTAEAERLSEVVGLIAVRG